MNMKLIKEVEVNLEDIKKILLGLPEEELVNLWNEYASNIKTTAFYIHPVEYPNEIVNEEGGEPLDVLYYITKDYDLSDQYCSIKEMHGGFVFYSFNNIFGDESPFELWALAKYLIDNAEEYMSTYLKGFHLIKDNKLN